MIKPIQKKEESSQYRDFSSGRIATSAASGLTAYRPYRLIGDGTANRVFILDAEL